MSELSEAIEDLAEARAAWKKALKAREYSHNWSGASINKQNHEIDKLLDSVKYFRAQVNSLSNNQGGVITSQISPQ